MPTKKILIVKTIQDVSMFTDEYIETVKAQILQTADVTGATVEVEVRKDSDDKPLPDLVDRLLQSIRAEFKANDERPRD